MPVIIPNALADYAKSITLDVDFRLFSDRQIKNVVKQLRTGCISRGNSMTAHLARWIRRQDTSNTPYAYFLYDTYDIKWNNIPNGHPFFDAVKQAASMNKLTQESNSQWYTEALDEIIKTATEQKPKGTVSSYRMGDYKKVVKKTMKVEQKLSDNMEDFITKLLNKTLGVVPIQLKEFSKWD
jgi:hypothetical protein